MKLNDNLCIFRKLVLVLGFTFLMIVLCTRPQSDLLDVQNHWIFKIFGIWLDDDGLVETATKYDSLNFIMVSIRSWIEWNWNFKSYELNQYDVSAETYRNYFHDKNFEDNYDIIIFYETTLSKLHFVCSNNTLLDTIFLHYVPHFIVLYHTLWCSAVNHLPRLRKIKNKW